MRRADVIKNEGWYVMDSMGIIRITPHPYTDLEKAEKSGYVCAKHKIIFTGKKAYQIHRYEEHGY